MIVKRDAAGAFPERDDFERPFGGTENQEGLLEIPYACRLIDGRLDRQSVGVRIGFRQNRHVHGRRRVPRPSLVESVGNGMRVQCLLHGRDQRAQVLP